MTSQSASRLNLGYAAIVFAFALVVALSWPGLPEKTVNVAASVACANIEPTLSLGAEAAYVEDLKTGTPLYEKKPDAQLPLASLTKLATVVTASRILAPDDTVVITPEALAPEGDAGLRIGEKWSAQDLIDFTLIESANDGAHAIALAAAAKKGETLDSFVRSMNDEARDLGMNESFFTNDTGLDVSSTTASAYGSARDVAKLLSYVVRSNPRLVESTTEGGHSFVSKSGITHTAENTSGVISSLDGGIASKTGYTDLAGGNLAVEFEAMPGRPVVAVVLGSTRDGRDTDMQALVGTAKTALKRVIICHDGS